MSSLILDQGIMNQLQEKQGKLLGLTRKLNGFNIGEMVDLPLFVVCGAQSSGKSSLLEAISGLKFPVNGAACTKFPIELNLIRDIESSISISITAGPSRTVPLEPFNERLENASQFPGLVTKAAQLIGTSDSDDTTFSDDTIVVNIKGPQQPHLTLVDLPGLVGGSATAHSFVEKLVVSYITRPRCLILAVLSGESDEATQDIRRIVPMYDREGFRTLWVVTKPDKLTNEPHRQTRFLNSVVNQMSHRGLGWHVVKSRDAIAREKSADITEDERETLEEEFFAKSVWNDVDKDYRGVSSLRARLSEILYQHTATHLRSLTNDIENQVRKRERELALLGQERHDPKDLKQYLNTIAYNFDVLVKAGINGNYDDVFFSQKDSVNWTNRRLYAAVYNLNTEFAQKMTERGRRWDFTAAGGPVEITPRLPTETSEDIISLIEKENLWSKSKSSPYYSSGKVPGSIFIRQSSRWQKYAEDHIASVSRAIRTFLAEVLQASADSHTAKNILEKIVYPEIKCKMEAATQMLQKLLRTNERSCGITFNINDFIRYGVMYEGKVKNRQENVQKAIIHEEAYYDVTLRVFIDNVAFLVIENCLMDELEKTFTRDKIDDMSGDFIQDLAAESDENRKKRKKLQAGRDALRDALDACNNFDFQSLEGETKDYFARGRASSIHGSESGESTSSSKTLFDSTPGQASTIQSGSLPGDYNGEL